MLTKKFPLSKVTSLSNSHSQKEYIDSQAQIKKLKNLTVVTGDVNDYEFPEHRFAISIDAADVVSIEYCQLRCLNI
jgi:hypothetical protein